MRPWLPDEITLFLENFLRKKSQPKVLEFGSGASTIWFVQQGAHVVSIEHDMKWYHTVYRHLEEIDGLSSVNLILHNRPYYRLCSLFSPQSFDVVLIDGRDRMECLRAAKPLVAPEGILLLDDADRARYADAATLFPSSWTPQSFSIPSARGWIFSLPLVF